MDYENQRFGSDQFSAPRKCRTPNAAAQMISGTSLTAGSINAVKPSRNDSRSSKFLARSIVHWRLSPIVLDSFSDLNGESETFDHERIEAHFKTSDHLKGVQFWPEIWPRTLTKVSGKTFTNVSLSKTKFNRVTFKECTFEDCLFIGTEFIEVEFHRCRFINCNFFKTSFQRCYLDPGTIKIDAVYKKTHANVFVTLFQRLLDNSAGMHQANFAALADIRFRQWKRAQIKFDLEKGYITKRRAFGLRFRSFLYEGLAGFGYKPWRFVGWTIVLFLMTSTMNGYFLSESLSLNGDPALHPSGWADSIFYSFSILTILGFSTITPVTAAAKLLTVFEALCAVGWLAILTSLLVKRLIR